MVPNEESQELATPNLNMKVPLLMSNSPGVQSPVQVSQSQGVQNLAPKWMAPNGSSLKRAKLTQAMQDLARTEAIPSGESRAQMGLNRSEQGLAMVEINPNVRSPKQASANQAKPFHVQTGTSRDEQSSTLARLNLDEHGLVVVEMTQEG